jgi:Zn-dependent protease
MGRAWKLGTLLGIGIYVHWTFLLLFPYTALRVWDREQAWTANLAGLGLIWPFLLCIFGCVLLHELGHAIAARFCSIGTRDITLYPIGGVARLERMSERPEEEILIAVAGPLVNVLIAALLAGGLLVAGVVGYAVGWLEMPLHVLSNPVAAFLGLLTLANGALVGFNLLPCFPMDGGRVLRAFLALGFGQVRATEVAAGLGIFVAFCLGLLPVATRYFEFPFPASPMLIVIAGFVVYAGQQELAGVRQRAAVRRLAQVVPAVPIRADLAAPPTPPSGDFSGFTWDEGNRVWVVWRDGRPMATFTVPPEERGGPA